MSLYVNVKTTLFKRKERTNNVLIGFKQLFHINKHTIFLNISYQKTRISKYTNPNYQKKINKWKNKR